MVNWMIMEILLDITGVCGMLYVEVQWVDRFHLWKTRKKKNRLSWGQRDGVLNGDWKLCDQASRLSKESSMMKVRVVGGEHLQFSRVCVPNLGPMYLLLLMDLMDTSPSREAKGANPFLSPAV